MARLVRVFPDDLPVVERSHPGLEALVEGLCGDETDEVSPGGYCFGTAENLPDDIPRFRLLPAVPGDRTSKERGAWLTPVGLPQPVVGVHARSVAEAKMVLPLLLLPRAVLALLPG